MSQQYVVEIFAGDRIEAELSDSGWSFRGIMCAGCRQLLSRLVALGKNPNEWPLPEGGDHSALLLRELILKIQGHWQFPYPHAEVCHCRAISTEAVDQAILSGAHSPEEVSIITTASTACGTCRPDIISILSYRGFS